MKILLAALSLLLFSPQSHAESFDVYLLAGQSNMDGRGRASELTADQGTHFDAASQLELGKRFSHQMKKELINE